MSAILPMPARRRVSQTPEDAMRFLFETTCGVRRLLRDGDEFGAYVTALLIIIWDPPQDAAPAIVRRLEQHRRDCIRDLSARSPEIAAAAERHGAALSASSPEGA
jgi:hypothetical protein